MYREIIVDGFKCCCSDINVHIVDSYKVKDIDGFLVRLKEALGKDYIYERDLAAWSDEWYAHNLVYRMGLFRQHTKDVDLNDDEYKIMIFMYKLVKPLAKLVCR